ncbi:isoprenylcysteine carboxylmethyltransferase family protein [bacterium]|nr:MAG: isoprenylcysteine carboxylmethyltransferase family protein [bacterium]
MNSIVVIFLAFFVPVLAVLLAWLGWSTLRDNPLGWFLFVTGVVYAVGVVIVLWIRRKRFWQSQLGGRTTEEEKGDRSFWLYLPGAMAAFFIPPIEYSYLPAILPRAAGLAWAGVILVLLGCALFAWARRTLRAAYSGHLNVTTEQILVQSGPYRIVRHPAYLGYVLMSLGVCLGYSSLYGLISIPVLLLPGLVYRIRTEDRLLEAHFQDQFRAYAARTARLIPRLW